MHLRRPTLCGGVILVLAVAVACHAQSSGKGAESGGNDADLQLVEKLLIARHDYQRALELLRAHYMSTGDVERRTWAEEELRQYHRIPHQAFNLKLELPPAT